jgi:sulfur relay (sulfurtransferase) DsrC/TusE family protein
MESEEILEKGHLSETKKLIDELSSLHWQLVKSDKTYFETFQKAKPHILQAVMDAEGQDLGNEIQICLNGVYGLLLCRLLGKKVSDEQLKSAEAFWEVLSLLNLVYQQERISRN